MRAFRKRERKLFHKFKENKSKTLLQHRSVVNKMKSKAVGTPALPLRRLSVQETGVNVEEWAKSATYSGHNLSDEKSWSLGGVGGPHLSYKSGSPNFGMDLLGSSRDSPKNEVSGLSQRYPKNQRKHTVEEFPSPQRAKLSVGHHSSAHTHPRHSHHCKHSSFFKLDKFLMSTYKGQYAWLARKILRNSKYLPDCLLKNIIKAIITKIVRHQLNNSRTENKPKNLLGWSTWFGAC